jgi:SAM-dependent methyltransferase
VNAKVAQIEQSYADITSTIRNIWDDEATGSDQNDGNLDATEPQREAWSVLLRRLFLPPEPSHVVDMGCGAGFITLALAELGHAVTGVDMSSRMLGVCRANAEKRGLADVRLVSGEAEQPPADVGPVDAVISRYLLWTLPRPEKAVRAWANLTKPGGRVIGIDALWTSELVRESVNLEYPAEIIKLLPLLHARDLEPVHNVWRRAGLEDVMVEELGWLDEIVRSEVSMGTRPLFRHMRLYLVEGTRPS